MKRLTDPTFVYTDAAESSKPGYLARKFAAIRREQERAKQKAEPVLSLAKAIGAYDKAIGKLNHRRKEQAK